MAELPKAVRDAQVAAVLTRIESYATARAQFGGTLPDDDLARFYVDAANTALLEACEVREVSWSRRPPLGVTFATVTEFDAMVPPEPIKVRHLIITTPTEEPTP